MRPHCPDGMARLGLASVLSLQIMFYFYAALGVVAAGLYLSVPRALPHDVKPRATPLGPSRGIVYRLAALFSLDAFAGGFAIQSLVALWLFKRFNLSALG